eukprot:gene2563-1286_t
MLRFTIPEGTIVITHTARASGRRQRLHPPRGDWAAWDVDKDPFNKPSETGSGLLRRSNKSIKSSSQSIPISSREGPVEFSSSAHVPAIDNKEVERGSRPSSPSLICSTVVGFNRGIALPVMQVQFLVAMAAMACCSMAAGQERTNRTTD